MLLASHEASRSEIISLLNCPNLRGRQVILDLLLQTCKVLVTSFLGSCLPPPFDHQSEDDKHQKIKAQSFFIIFQGIRQKQLILFTSRSETMESERKHQSAQRESGDGKSAQYVDLVHIDLSLQHPGPHRHRSQWPNRRKAQCTPLTHYHIVKDDEISCKFVAYSLGVKIECGITPSLPKQ